jgi:hypothetical protein
MESERALRATATVPLARGASGDHPAPHDSIAKGLVMLTASIAATIQAKKSSRWRG